MRWFFLMIKVVFGFTGVYQVIYPIRKLVRFDSNNHFVDREHIVVFSKHPLHRQRFRIHNVTNDHFLLVNVNNGSDYMILAPKFSV